MWVKGRRNKIAEPISHECPPPSGITKHYIYECPSSTSFTSFAFVYRRRWVKSSSYVTALKLWSSITRDRSIVETRSQRAKQYAIDARTFGNVRFIVRREINFAKVKNRHFRRTECLDNVALDILNVSRDFHRSAKAFAISVKSTSFVVAKVIEAWKFSTPSAFGRRWICWLLKNIVPEDIKRRLCFLQLIRQLVGNTSVLSNVLW